MKRLNNPTPEPACLGIITDTKGSPIIIANQVMNLFLKQPSPSDLISLYSFYRYTGIWQNTEQPRATNTYTAKALAWGKDRVSRVKNELKMLGLVKDIIRRDTQNRITGYFIKTYYLPKEINTNGEDALEIKSQYPSFPIVENEGVNSLRSKYINSLNLYMWAENSKKSSNKIPIMERNKTYLPIARYLSGIIQSQKNITHTPQQIRSWTNEIRQLCEGNKIPPSRIKQALQWYKRRIGGEYVPVIESGASLRLKFDKLESAIKRDSQPNLTNRTNTVGSRNYSPPAKFREYDEKIEITF